MVKFTTICRAGQVRETQFDIQKVHRNPDPTQHPLEKAREYQRALVATKVEKIFAQPFLGALNGHSDSISCIGTCLQNLQKVVSGSFDGEIRIWDVPSRKTLIQLNAHQLMVKGVSFSVDGMRVLSSGEDKTVNLWDFPGMLENRTNQFQEPIARYLSKGSIGNVDHCYNPNSHQFATSGQIVQIWNYERSKPIMKFDWGIDTILTLKYSPSDENLICATSMDRCLILYDVRAETPVHKVQMLNKSQGLAWNPLEPINVTIGSDDTNCYTFDIRKMTEARQIHKDHIQAVLSVAYNPTGREFASGSFDKTVRIFPTDRGVSREVYHGQRMQQINAVAFSQDGQWIFSGSNDMNVRIWKAHASQKIGIINKREENAINYRAALKSKFQYNREIKRIAKHRHLPKYILNAKKKNFDQKQSKVRKLKNKEINNTAEFVKPKPERQSRVAEFIE